MAKKGRDEKGKFIEGNQLSVGNNGGRTLRFPTPELLKEKCDSYFEWADANPWIKTEQKKTTQKIDLMEMMMLSKEEGVDFDDLMKGASNPIVELPTQRPYTLIALCHHIGITKECWRDYEDRTEFADLTTRVRERIENQQIEGALVGAFNANLTARLQGISDKKEIQGEIKTSQIDLSKLDEETLRKLKDSQKKP